MCCLIFADQMEITGSKEAWRPLEWANLKKINLKKLWRIAKDLLEATLQFLLHIGETSHYEEDYGKVRH